ncbi:hypothetical protein QYM36_013357 [Artemia franciscana]|uniref:Uncharacterized protein n=1 Tax=Artemia franciscana TaxID=6661 RepID=A0AA88HG23_ARTSF|nr:hypothetical protein QYM36_013357 [Artemia franciscana]
MEKSLSGLYYIQSTKSNKFRVMAEGIGDGSDFESSSSDSDNEPGELLAGTVDVADKTGGDTKHKRKKAVPKKREFEGVAYTSDTGSSSSESELEELVVGTVGDVDKRKTGTGSKRKRTQVVPKIRSLLCSWEQDEKLKHFVFQSGDTMIHTLITSFRSTLKAIMRCFVKLEILNRSEAFELPLEPRNYKGVKDVLCGPKTEAYLNEEGASVKSVIQRFY